MVVVAVFGALGDECVWFLKLVLRAFYEMINIKL